MANELNRVEFIGNVGNTPESRYTKAGHMVTNFSVAATKKITSETCPDGWVAGKKANEWQLTTWYRVTAWRKLAEIVATYVEKGRQVMVTGEPGGNAVNGKNEITVYQAKDGSFKAAREVTASRVTMLGSRNGNGSSSDGSQVDGPPAGFVEENEIPF